MDIDPSQPDETLDIDAVARELRLAAVEAAPEWIRRVTFGVVAAQGLHPPDADAFEDLVVSTTTELDRRLAVLLSSDIDAQRTTPLSIFRQACASIGAFLSTLGAVPTVTPGVGGEPSTDPYGITPGNLADVGDRVHQAGMMWGAHKAALHLRRRRDEGLR